MLRKAIATTADDTRLHYQVWGEPRPSKRIALIHSLAMNSDFWTYVADCLTPDFEVLVIDCRGHGRSDKVAGPYSVELFADDLAAVLDHAGWQDCLVSGASMGGCAVLAFAARYPQRVAGLGLFDTIQYYGPTAVTDWEERAGKALNNGMAALIDFQKTRWFSDSFRAEPPSVVDDAIAVFLANDLSSYAETCRMLGRCDMRPALPHFTIPVEIVVGEEDYATPVKMVQDMEKNIKRAKLTILTAARHFTPLEAPRDIARAIAELHSGCRVVR